MMNHSVRIRKTLAILALSVVAAVGFQVQHAAFGPAAHPAADTRVVADSGWGPAVIAGTP